MYVSVGADPVTYRGAEVPGMLSVKGKSASVLVPPLIVGRRPSPAAARPVVVVGDGADDGAQEAR